MDVKSYRFLFDGRDRCIPEFELPTSPPTLARVCVFWDADRDTQILLVLLAVRYRSPMALAQILAVREQQGRIDWWCAGTDAKAAHRALVGAADAALHPRQHWDVNPPKLVPLIHGVPDWSALPPEDPVRAANKRHALGVVGGAE